MELIKLLQSNHFAKVKHLLGPQSQFHIDEKTQTIKLNSVMADWTTPWIMHTTKSLGMNCTKWHQILFPCFDVLPKECMECFKVVVRPENVVELIKLKKIQDGLPKDIQCKCGTESQRSNIEAAYGGYFYSRGIEAGLDMLDIVKIMLKDKVKGDIFLKRACTEYEQRFGPSNTWDYNPKEAEYSKWIDDSFHQNCWEKPLLPEMARKDIVSRWLYYAASIGDLSYLEETNGRHLHEVPIKYERIK